MTTRGRSSDAEPKKLTTGQRLSKLIADRGVTAKWLAGRVQIQESTLANFRKGFRRIPPDVVAGMLPVTMADNGAQFRAAFSNGSCPTVYSATATLTVQQFTDPTITQGVTPIRQIHFEELRDRILQLRTQYGVNPAQFPYTNATLTNVTAADMTEMRTALAQAYTAASRTPPSYTNAINQGTSKVTKTDVDELRAACVALE